MWEPVEVKEWLEIRRTRARRGTSPREAHIVWCTEVSRLASPDAPPLVSQCGLMRWTRALPNDPLGNEWRAHQTREAFWRRLTDTGHLPASSWTRTRVIRRHIPGSASHG
jgi:hypothetical protein